MNIQNIKLNKINNCQQDKTQTLTTSSATKAVSNGNLKSYPSGYYLSFGTRSIKEVYGNFSDTEMPSTVKCFIDDLAITLPKNKFEMLIAQPRLYQIQREAFRQLDDCHNVDEIKEVFASEKCLKNIRSINEVPQSVGGIFSVIAEKQRQGEQVFDIDEDLSVYLAKQLFYECVSITDIQKILASLAIDGEIKEKIQNSANWYAKTFLPLGIIVPDGRKYGSAVLYSEDRRYAAELSEALRNSWKNLSPEEVTKRIDGLLQGNEKERLTMIDTWNKCVALRNELSEFLFEKLDSDEYDISQDDLVSSFYEGNFPIKLRKIMIDFWETHPQEKEELGVEIKKSRKLYEEKLAQGEEVFEAYKKDILAKRNFIKQKLTEERQKARSFDSAKELIKGIAQKSKNMYIKNNETVDDLYNVLLQHITNSQLKIYEQRLLIGDNIDEFNQVYPPYQQIKNAKNSLEYANILSAQILTILTPDLKRGKISEDEFFAALQDKASLDKLIEKSLANRTTLELNEYSKLKKPLSQNEKTTVGNILTQYLPQNEDTIGYIESFLDTQGKYLLQVTSENKLIQNATLLSALQKIDEACETHSVQNFIEQLQDEKIQQSKLDALSSIDWNIFKATSWDM